MKELLGELRGLAERMTEAQERQFNTMLEAFVTRPQEAAEVAERISESATAATEVAKDFEALRANLGNAHTAAEIETTFEELSQKLAELREGSANAARLAGEARGLPASATPDFDMRVDPEEIPVGGEVSIPISGRHQWDQKGFAELFVFPPEGAPVSVKLHQNAVLSYPTDFPGASTASPGRYNVELCYTEWRGTALMHRHYFRVIEPV